MDPRASKRRREHSREYVSSRARCCCCCLLIVRLRIVFHRLSKISPSPVPRPRGTQRVATHWRLLPWKPSETSFSRTGDFFPSSSRQTRTTTTDRGRRPRCRIYARKEKTTCAVEAATRNAPLTGNERSRERTATQSEGRYATAECVISLQCQ